MKTITWNEARADYNKSDFKNRMSLTEFKEMQEIKLNEISLNVAKIKNDVEIVEQYIKELGYNDFNDTINVMDFDKLPELDDSGLYISLNNLDKIKENVELMEYLEEWGK